MRDPIDRIIDYIDQGSTSLGLVRFFGLFLLAFCAILQAYFLYHSLGGNVPGWPGVNARLFLAGGIVLGVGLVGRCRWAILALGIAPVLGLLTVLALLVAAGDPLTVLGGGVLLVPGGAVLWWLARMLAPAWRGSSWLGRYRP
jgi:hypothetical protein